MKESRFTLDIKKKILESAEALEQVTQGNCGYLIPGSV